MGPHSAGLASGGGGSGGGLAAVGGWEGGEGADSGDADEAGANSATVTGGATAQLSHEDIPELDDLVEVLNAAGDDEGAGAGRTVSDSEEAKCQLEDLATRAAEAAKLCDMLEMHPEVGRRDAMLDRIRTYAPADFIVMSLSAVRARPPPRPGALGRGA